MADLLLAIATICRVSGTAATLLEDGRVEFKREGRVVTSALVASGRGYRSELAVEAELQKQRTKSLYSPTIVIVAGTSDARTTVPTPPEDIVASNKKDDILPSPTTLTMLHVSDLRTSDGAIKQIVP